MQIPDLEAGGFEQLTVSRQIELLGSLINDKRCILIGSSLGGYLASLYAARHATVKSVVLLAPAFGFYQLWMAQLGPKLLTEWQRTGCLKVFHHGQGREMPLSYGFIEDAARHEPFPDVRQPALLFHGNQDQVVPVEQSLAFVQNHPAANLLRFESGHELTDVLESIWREAGPFLLESGI